MAGGLGSFVFWAFAIPNDAVKKQVGPQKMLRVAG
jgi:hypothetical protein